MVKIEDKDIIARINNAKDAGIYAQKKTSWDTYINYFENGASDSRSPEFNLPYVFGSSLIPNLIFQNPYILAVPTNNKPETIKQAMLWESLDNFLVGHIGIRDEVKKAVTYAFCTNVGILEIGWDSADAKPISDKEKESPFPRISRVDSRRRRNFPWVQAVDPREIIIPTGYTSMRYIPWYARKVCLPKAEIEVLPELKGKKIKYNYQSKSDSLIGGEKDLTEYLTFYIYRSVEDQKVTWITPEGEVLFQADDPLQADGLPLVTFSFNPTLSDFWGTPDVAYIETQYLEGNELRKDGRWQRKNATLKVFYDTNMVTENDMQKFLDGEPLPAIGIDVPTGKTLDQCVKELQPNVQREYLEYADFLMKDSEYILGFGPNQMGTVSRGRRTAFEMQQVAQNNMLRLASRRDSVANSIGEVFTKINALCEKNWKGKQILPILGPDLSFYYAEIQNSDLKGLASLTTKVSADSIAPTSVEKRRSDMLEVMGVLGQFSPESAQLLRPLVQRFISLFDWGELQSVLPVQQGTPQLSDIPLEGDPRQNMQMLQLLNPAGQQPQPTEEIQDAQQA